MFLKILRKEVDFMAEGVMNNMDSNPGEDHTEKQPSIAAELGAIVEDLEMSACWIEPADALKDGEFRDLVSDFHKKHHAEDTYALFVASGGDFENVNFDSFLIPIFKAMFGNSVTDGTADDSLISEECQQCRSDLLTIPSSGMQVRLIRSIYSKYVDYGQVAVRLDYRINKEASWNTLIFSEPAKNDDLPLSSLREILRQLRVDSQYFARMRSIVKKMKAYGVRLSDYRRISIDSKVGVVDRGEITLTSLRDMCHEKFFVNYRGYVDLRKLFERLRIRAALLDINVLVVKQYNETAFVFGEGSFVFANDAARFQYFYTTEGLVMSIHNLGKYLSRATKLPLDDQRLPESTSDGIQDILAKHKLLQGKDTTNA